ncbi:MAG: NADH-quinone oxidoreductase subunit L, partial [Candidatus Omnitrophica bacterium]|nr:NADH-quinone oxidoreductase subunit L [Candidatus Omnitrophota bacterium]
MVNSPILIPLLPLLAFVLIVFFGKWLREKSAWIAILASSLSCFVSLSAILKVIQGSTIRENFTWLTINQIPLEFGIGIDPLSAMMLFVVTFVGTLIVIYSVGYMHGDPRYARFFAYISL